MSDKIKTSEELAAEAFPPDGNGFSNRHNRDLCLDAIRKQAEQDRPYMRHLDGCDRDQPMTEDRAYVCTCGLYSILNAMK